MRPSAGTVALAGLLHFDGRTTTGTNKAGLSRGDIHSHFTTEVMEHRSVLEPIVSA